MNAPARRDLTVSHCLQCLHCLPPSPTLSHPLSPSLTPQTRTHLSDLDSIVGTYAVGRSCSPAHIRWLACRALLSRLLKAGTACLSLCMCPLSSCHLSTHALPRFSRFPQWVAPEVLMGGRQCTSAVDLFSLGVCLWEASWHKLVLICLHAHA